MPRTCLQPAAAAPPPTNGSCPATNSRGPASDPVSREAAPSCHPIRGGPSPVKLPKSVFITVDQLKPATQGNNLVADVLSARTVLNKPSPSRRTLVECLVRDHTAASSATRRCSAERYFEQQCPPR
ncbi:hypothetical protein ACQ4PT_020401 [Festuca glaucescens]